jgi:hypothetical protein
MNQTFTPDFRVCVDTLELLPIRKFGRVQHGAWGTRSTCKAAILARNVAQIIAKSEGLELPPRFTRYLDAVAFAAALQIRAGIIETADQYGNMKDYNLTGYAKRVQEFLAEWQTTPPVPYDPQAVLEAQRQSRAVPVAFGIPAYRRYLTAHEPPAFGAGRPVAFGVAPGADAETLRAAAEIVRDFGLSAADAVALVKAAA